MQGYEVCHGHHSGGGNGVRLTIVTYIIISVSIVLLMLNKRTKIMEILSKSPMFLFSLVWNIYVASFRAAHSIN